MSEQARIDKWLWGARFFKTRALARAAVHSGRVEVNGQRVKPARNLKLGDRLVIRRGDELWEVEVADLADRRVGAELAATRYQESAASRERRETLAEQRRLQREQQGERPHRPDKRQRRQIVKFRGF